MSTATRNITSLIGIAFVMYMVLTSTGVNVDNQAVVGNYKTKYFPLSGGESLRIFKEMKDNNAQESTLKEFLQMEDSLLKMEYNTVISGGSYHIQGTSLSSDIKDRFVGYDFGYHDVHIKQMAEPSKLVNKYMYV